MPIYEYRRPDGTTFELIQSFSEPALKKDPETGVKVERVLHAPAVHFKGKGFYNTDYGTKKRQRETAAAGEASANGKDSSSESAGSDSGSASESKTDSRSSHEGQSSSGAQSSPEGKSKEAKASKKDAKAPTKPVAAAK